MCLAPQRRALFPHPNFQKWCEHGVFCIRTTTVCNFSFLIWPNGSAPAALASLLFDPPEPQIIGETKCFATFLAFGAPVSSVFWLFLYLYFSLLLLSSLWLFPSPLFISPYCRKFEATNPWIFRDFSPHPARPNKLPSSPSSSVWSVSSTCQLCVKIIGDTRWRAEMLRLYGFSCLHIVQPNLFNYCFGVPPPSASVLGWKLMELLGNSLARSPSIPGPGVKVIINGKTTNFWEFQSNYWIVFLLQRAVSKKQHRFGNCQSRSKS